MMKMMMKSETMKFFTHRWILLTISATAFFLPAMALVLNPAPKSPSISFITNNVLQSFYLGQAFFIVISALYIGQEFTRSTLRTSLLCVPNRWMLLSVKITSLLSFILFFFILFALLTILISHLYFQHPFTIATFTFLMKSLLPSLLSTLTLSMIASALTLLSTSSLFSLSLLLPLLLGFGQLLLQFGNIFRFFPILAVMNGFSLTPSPVYPNIMTGFFIQLLWGSILFLLSGLFFVKKSVH